MSVPPPIGRPSDNERVFNLELPPNPLGARAARAFVLSALAHWGVSAFADDAEQVMAELVNNSLRIATEIMIGIAFIAHTNAVVVVVWDDGAGWPMFDQPDEDDAVGRGLLLVDAIADEWGCLGGLGGVGRLIWARFG